MCRNVVVVEGIIGAGKSTLIKNLSMQLEKMGYTVCPIYEPIELWRKTGLLQKLYSDPARFSFVFQVGAFITRLVDINNTISVNPDADIYILERSTESGKLFAPNFWDKIDPVEKTLLTYMHENLTNSLHVDLSKAQIIYLNPSVQTCMARMRQRNRFEEVCHETDKDATGVTFGYQRILADAHNALFLQDESYFHDTLRNTVYTVPENVIEIGANIMDIDANESTYVNDVLIPIINLLSLD